MDRTRAAVASLRRLLQPEPARELGERKARAVLDTGAELMVTADLLTWARDRTVQAFPPTVPQEVPA